MDTILKKEENFLRDKYMDTDIIKSSKYKSRFLKQYILVYNKNILNFIWIYFKSSIIYDIICIEKSDINYEYVKLCFKR